MFLDSFGFLPEPVTLDFGAGRITPVADHAVQLEAVQAAANLDGFYYPPTQVSTRRDSSDPSAEFTEVPQSRRPAPLFRMPSSHEIAIDSPQVDEARNGDAGFVMHAIASLYGRRLQFADWWLEGRVPVGNGLHHVHIHPTIASRFLAGAYDTWAHQPEPRRKALTNIAYMHARAGCYEWHWEAFFVEYMVLDAVYAYARGTERVRHVPHKDRIQALCDAYGLWSDPTVVRRIVTLRNELFHEALWDGSLPGQDVSDDGRLHGIYLRCLNHRLVPAILGWSGEYVRTPWTQWRGMYAFE